MRIFNLLLVLIMLVCYSGICSSATAISYMEPASESCHEMDNHNSSQDTKDTIQSSNQTANDNSTCCFDSLINNVDDSYPNTFVTLKPIAFISDSIVVKDNHRNKHMSLRGHSPPDLQVLNSTFLI